MVRTSMRLFYFEFPIKRFLQETAKIFYMMLVNQS